MICYLRVISSTVILCFHNFFITLRYYLVMDGFWLWLYSFDGIGSKKIIKLRDKVYSKPGSRGWRVLLARKLTKNAGFSDESIHTGIQKLYARLKKLEIGVIPYWSPKYPRPLRELPDFPAFLLYKGNLKPGIFDRCISIVGTRGMTQYGRSVVSRLVGPLGDFGVTVVSGLAFGIDAEVHRSLMKNGCGFPVAVVPGGPDRGFPEENRSLYNQVLKRGLIVSEHLPGTRIVPGMFASRNRIIAGLSGAVVVVEAPEKSGALITADLALQYGRDVYAVPGSVFNRMSIGTNELINQGAFLVKDGYDILRNLGFLDAFDSENNGNCRTSTFLSKEFGISVTAADALFARLGESCVAVEEVSTFAGKSVSEIRRILTQLEIKGIFMRDCDGKYKLCGSYFETSSSRVACKG